MDNELVSIAMTTYNGEKFLREQLDSIYNQTYNNIEIVVTDDCSNDNTVNILKEYTQKLRLKWYINDKNIGFVKNFGRAISLCKGKYIALADQDDVWLPEKLEVLVRNINQYSLICSDAYLIDQNGKFLANSLKNVTKKLVVDGKPFRYLIYNNFVTGCTSLFKRELIPHVLPMPEGGIFHDWWLAIVASKKNGIRYLHKPLVYYRQHLDSQTGFTRKKKALWRIIFSLVNYKIFIQKRQNFMIQRRENYKRLKGIENNPIFTKSDKDFLNETIEFFKTPFESKFHLKAFSLAIKNRKYIYTYAKSPLERLAYIMGELIY